MPLCKKKSRPLQCGYDYFCYPFIKIKKIGRLFKGASEMNDDIILSYPFFSINWSSKKQMHILQMFQFRIINNSLFCCCLLSSIGNYFFESDVWQRMSKGVNELRVWSVSAVHISIDFLREMVYSFTALTKIFVVSPIHYLVVMTSGRHLTQGPTKRLFFTLLALYLGLAEDPLNFVLY